MNQKKQHFENVCFHCLVASRKLFVVPPLGGPRVKLLKLRGCSPMTSRWWSLDELPVHINKLKTLDKLAR